MSENPYSKFNKEKLILRDRLAVDRTILANERTFLAYIRTALGFFAAGVLAIKFFDSISIEAIGWLFILLGIITLVIGLKKYREVKWQVALSTQELLEK
jgi:putative membrane protein